MAQNAGDGQQVDQRLLHIHDRSFSGQLGVVCDGAHASHPFPSLTHITGTAAAGRSSAVAASNSSRSSPWRRTRKHNRFANGGGFLRVFGVETGLRGGVAGGGGWI